MQTYIELRCRECDTLLGVEVKNGEIEVEPCEKCIEEAKADLENYDKGYEHGYDSGREETDREAFEDGKIEGYKEGYDDARREFEQQVADDTKSV